jgi:hypothetical protein
MTEICSMPNGRVYEGGMRAFLSRAESSYRTHGWKEQSLMTLRFLNVKRRSGVPGYDIKHEFSGEQRTDRT